MQKKIIITINNKENIIEDKVFELASYVRIDFNENKYGKRLNLLNDYVIQNGGGLYLKTIYDDIVANALQVIKIDYLINDISIIKKDSTNEVNYSIIDICNDGIPTGEIGENLAFSLL